MEILIKLNIKTQITPLIKSAKMKKIFSNLLIINSKLLKIVYSFYMEPKVSLFLYILHYYIHIGTQKKIIKKYIIENVLQEYKVITKVT